MPREILSFYRFQITDPVVCADAFYAPAVELGLLGTVLVAEEGWNVNLWAESQLLDLYLQRLKDKPEFVPTQNEIKRMEVSAQPFRKLARKIKTEIIKLGIPVDRSQSASTYVTAEELHSRLQAGEKITMLDVRNRYEMQVGTFAGAVDPGVDTFQEFPEAMSKLELDREKPVVTFCTGGIRCEKAVPYLQSIGYKNVLQIEGGIWKYLEKYPDGFFKGDCFWFDEREER
ncbi:MAG: sulfurtransferase [Spirochaetia bacterium]|nr:sulfurtransferase [Spirochaetia bacterium]